MEVRLLRRRLLSYCFFGLVAVALAAQTPWPAQNGTVATNIATATFTDRWHGVQIQGPEYWDMVHHDPDMVVFEEQGPYASRAMYVIYFSDGFPKLWWTMWGARAGWDLSANANGHFTARKGAGAALITSDAIRRKTGRNTAPTRALEVEAQDHGNWVSVLVAPPTRFEGARALFLALESHMYWESEADKNRSHSCQRCPSYTLMNVIVPMTLSTKEDANLFTDIRLQ